MMTLPESYSSIQLAKFHSYDVLQQKLDIWLKSSSKGWGYEKHETNDQTILWAKSWTGTDKFIIINKNKQSTEETALSLYAGVLTNLSIFRFT
jgi:hypothetical protein